MIILILGICCDHSLVHASTCKVMLVFEIQLTQGPQIEDLLNLQRTLHFFFYCVVQIPF